MNWIEESPGQSKITTQRKEPDTVEFLSGIFEGKTTGTPIGFVIKNTNQKSKDYSHIKETYRPSHADWVYDQKYGFRDYTGGGRSSARETVSRVVAGAIAKQLVSPMKITAYVSQVGNIKLNKDHSNLDFEAIESNIVRCPDTQTADQMIDLISSIKKKGDTIGGVVKCVIQNVPVGSGRARFSEASRSLRLCNAFDQCGERICLWKRI